MKLSVSDENAKILAHLLGLEDDEAAELLSMSVTVSADASAWAQHMRRHLVEMLTRTVASVRELPSESETVHIILGSPNPQDHARAARRVYVGVTDNDIVISCEEVPPHRADAEVPEILLLIAACYAAGMAIRIGVGDSFRLPFHNTIRVPVDLLLRDAGEALRRPVHLGHTYLVGAGAIGNGFLWALATLAPMGELHVVDPKTVSEGNLGRCVWFCSDDIGHPKAERLVERARAAFPKLALVARTSRMQELAERSGDAWLARLIVAVDSRRARRRLQEELPLEVLDASTTGIEEVVLHFNSARIHAACLSCIYGEDAAEDAHERHVAELLGVEASDVREHFISAGTAQRIAKRHPDLVERELVGVAYDTLFKTLCATGRLSVNEGRTVLAPFAFVSTLAGAYLALELALRLSAVPVATPFNYWRASPWTSPVLELRAHRPPDPACEACGNPTIRATIRSLWGPNEQETT